MERSPGPKHSENVLVGKRNKRNLSPFFLVFLFPSSVLLVVRLGTCCLNPQHAWYQSTCPSVNPGQSSTVGPFAS